MRSRLRTLALASVVALGGLLGAGVGVAKAQVVVAAPGIALGVGAPVVGVYPAYAPYAYAPVYGAYPIRPYPYAYGRPGFYGPRPYAYSYGYRYGGYRRW